MARSPWWPWAGCRTLHSARLWWWPRRGCDVWHKVSCACAILCHIPGSARLCGVTPQLVMSHALCHTVSCATSCATSPRVPHCVPCHGPHPSLCQCHLSHRVVPHAPHHPMSHLLCPGEDIRHSLATRTQLLRTHSHQDRHRDRGTQGHDVSVAHGPRSALYFLLPLYKNKEVPRGRGHCPSL